MAADEIISYSVSLVQCVAPVNVLPAMQSPPRRQTADPCGRGGPCPSRFLAECRSRTEKRWEEV